MQEPVSRKEQLNDMPDGFVACRVLVGNHVPASGWPTVTRLRDGSYEQAFVCANCGTTVYQYRDRHGFRDGGRRYSYVPGYLMREGGVLTRSEKAALFLGMAEPSPKVTKIRKGRRSA